MKKMYLNRMSALAVLLAAAIFGFILYQQYISNIGFPDGYISEYEAAMKRVSQVLIALLLTLSVFCLNLAFTAKNQDGKNHLLFLISSFTLLMVVFLCAMTGFYQSLDHGQGG